MKICIDCGKEFEDIFEHCEACGKDRYIKSLEDMITRLEFLIFVNTFELKICFGNVERIEKTILQYLKNKYEVDKTNGN